VDVALIAVPYHLGHLSVGMGAGPDRLLDGGVGDALRGHGHEVEVVRVSLDPQPNEVAALFATAGLVSRHVAAAVDRGAFPLVLSGNCFCSLGTVAGVGDDLGVVWLDAHPDFNTAEATTSGFADGMGLAVLTGTGWNALRATIPGYRIVPERNVILVGARDINPAEEARLQASGITRLDVAEAGSRLTPVATELAARVEAVYVHLDLDVLDPSEGRANEYAAAGGLRASDVSSAIDAIGRLLAVRAAAVTAYDPTLDPDGSLAETAVELVARIVDTASVKRADRVSA
jgi:arginase